jgi:hypothetical protein
MISTKVEAATESNRTFWEIHSTSTWGQYLANIEGETEQGNAVHSRSRGGRMLERKLGLHRLPSISPWVVYTATRQ